MFPGTVTRACEEGGIWEDKTNYTNCVPLQSPPESNDDWMLEITTWVYFTGYCLSITALILAVSIFIALKYVISYPFLHTLTISSEVGGH